MNKLLDELTLDMIPEGLSRQIAETIGIEHFYKLAEIIDGSTVYIPKAENLLRPVRTAHIMAEFNGYNHTELAKKYGVTERWVRKLGGERRSRHATT